ncbi:hypothetical protein AWRIB418_1408 [Oenococcus oeni AWRIB418]|nr:hypothetical protein AWRIB418_1408 [Oenococcus oeni AWRIB418]
MNILFVQIQRLDIFKKSRLFYLFGPLRYFRFDILVFCFDFWIGKHKKSKQLKKLF